MMDSNQARLLSRMSVFTFLLICNILFFCSALPAGAQQGVPADGRAFDMLNSSIQTPILYAEPAVTPGTDNTVYWNGVAPEAVFPLVLDREAPPPQPPLQTVSETLRRKDDLRADDYSEPAQAILNLNSVFIPEVDENEELSASESLLGPVTVFSETFEGSFPGASWTLSGDPTWNITDYDKHGGSFSAWCGGSTLDPSVGYTDNMSASMVYGPFSLADATSAGVSFWYKNLSEANFDNFGWYASVNGTDFYGSSVSGDQNTWRNQKFDLASVPTLGDLRGQPQVWIAFIFTSDISNSGYTGAYVDDIIISKDDSTLPNLTPYQPSGWSDKIVVSTGTGTNTDSSPLYTTDTLYVDWAVTNNETGDTTSRFYTELYVDDVLKTSWYTDPPLSLGSYDYVLDYSIGPLMKKGTHTIRIKTDSTGVIAEGIESDNEYTKTITVVEPIIRYYAECADNSSFTNASSTPWTLENVWTFTDLTIGQTYWYRVKAKIDTTESDWSNVEFSQQVESHPGSLQFSAATFNVNENDGKATITVTRNGGTDGTVGVFFAASDGTATIGNDYRAIPDDLYLSWGDGDSASKTFTVTIFNDTVYEGNETVNLALTNPWGASLGSQITAVLTIIEDDAPPVSGSLQFDAATYNVNENGGTATITVTRTGSSSGEVSVHYATSNGTATDESDYTATSGDLSWANGDSAIKTFTVSIINNTVWEGDKTINLTLSSPTGGATLGSRSTAVLTIIENDPPARGTLQFDAATYNATENGATATITVTRTGGSDGTAGVHYDTSNGTATAGSDYTTKSGDLSWANGDSASKTFSVSITNDNIYEGDEDVHLTLSSPTGGVTLGARRTAVLTIIEDDLPAPGTLQFSSATYPVGESGVAIFTVTRTGGTDGAVSVHYATSNGTATAGSDYAAKSGNLSWTNGNSTSKIFTVSIISDTVYEGNETVNLTLSSPTGGATLGAQSTATMIIIDNDPPVPGTLQFSAATYNVNENGGTATITVTRTGGSDGAVSVHYATSNGTATAGSDYTATSGDLSWANGDSASKTFTMNITNDSVYEDDETINLTLSSPTGDATLGAQSTAVLTIVETVYTQLCGKIYDGYGGPLLPADNPHVITCDIVIPTNQTLTIYPGVEILFIQSCNITANGSLSADGSTGSIIFYSSQTEPPRFKIDNQLKIGDGGILSLVP